MASTLTASLLGTASDRSNGVLSTQLVCDGHLQRHRGSRPAKCCLRHRLPVVSAVSATASNPAPPPDVWSTLREAAESAVAEAEILRRAFSSSAQEAFDTSRECLKDFSTSADLPGKVREIADSVNARVEEVAFDASREANRLDIQYRVSERFEVAKLSARQAAQELECRYQLRQKLRQLQWETSYILILGLRLLHGARQSPLFPYFLASFFLWMFLSGLMAHIFYWMMWIVPLFPIVARAVTKAALIEGNCPSCGHRFIGPRKNKLSCRQCNEVVWQPRGKPGSPSAGRRAPQPLVVVDLKPDGTFC